jgi:hypothetical protein
MLVVWLSRRARGTLHGIRMLLLSWWLWFLDTIHCCYVASDDCLCLRSSCCFSFDAKPLGCGFMTTDKSQLGGTEEEMCKIGCMLCDCAVIHPITKLCSTARQCLWCYMAASIPFSTLYMDKPVCALLCLQCTPNSGCCKEYVRWWLCILSLTDNSSSDYCPNRLLFVIQTTKNPCSWEAKDGNCLPAPKWRNDAWVNNSLSVFCLSPRGHQSHQKIEILYISCNQERKW